MIVFLDEGIFSEKNVSLEKGVSSEKEGINYLDKLKEYVGTEETVTIRINEEIDWNRTHRALEEASALALVCRVCMDSVPSRVLSFLEQVEQAVIHGESIPGKFYAVLYTDLYEGEQTGVAMGVLRNFCRHANIVWGRGLGIGGNRMTGLRKPLFFRKKHAHACMSHLDRPIMEHAMFIREHMQGIDHFISPEGVSRTGYMRQVNHEAKKSHRIKIVQN